MEPKDLRKQLEETVNAVVDERLEGKAPKATPSKATTPLNVAQTPAAVAPSAPAAGAPTQNEAPVPTEPVSGTYEVSTQGDARFSALNAVLSDGMTIEEKYNMEIKGYIEQVGEAEFAEAMKMKPRQRYDILVRPFKGKDPINGKTPEQVAIEYDGLWEQWATENPQLIDELAQASKGKKLTDKFATKPDRPSQARSLEKILAKRATSPVSDQGGLPVPSQAQTPLSVAPTAISGESAQVYAPLIPDEVLGSEQARKADLDSYGYTQDGNVPFRGQIPEYDKWFDSLPPAEQSAFRDRRFAPSPEKITTAPTPVVPPREVNPADWRRIALEVRGEREPVLTDEAGTKVKRAVRSFLSEPHTLYDRVYDLYLRALDQGTGRLTRSGFKAVDSLNDPAHQNRGRQAVRAVFLHYMLNFIKEANDPKVAKAREQFLTILEDAGLSPADVANAEKLEPYYPNKAVQAEEDNLSVIDDQIKAITRNIADLHAEGRTGVLMHPDNAQAIAWMMREIDDGSRELLDGTRKQFNPARESTYVQGAASKAAMELLTPEDMAKLGIEPGADAHADKAKIGVTPNQVAQYRRGSVRRYALDAAGLIDPRWQEVDERGLDLQEAFQNDRHPTADTAAAISFHVTSDATSGDNRNIIDEIKATKALRAYMVSQLGEQADIPGRIRGMALKEDPSLRVARGAEEYSDTIRLNRSIGYTRDTSLVYSQADKIRESLAANRLVMVRMGKPGQSGVSQVATSDGNVFYLDDVFAIFSADDPVAQDLARKTGGSVSEPFRIGDEVKYPGGVKPGDYDAIKFDVDPVVHQAVQHTVPLLKPNGKEFKLAYVPANLAAGLTSKPVISDNLRPSQFGPAQDALLTHVIADNGVYPAQGTLADGYVYGDAYADLGPIYSETVRPDEPGSRPLSPGDTQSAFESMRAREEAIAAGSSEPSVMSEAIKGNQDQGIEGKFQEDLIPFVSEGIPPTGGGFIASGNANPTVEILLSKMATDTLLTPEDVMNAYSEVANSIADGSIRSILTDKTNVGLMLEAGAASKSKEKNLQKVALRRKFRRIGGNADLVVSQVLKWLDTPGGKEFEKKIQEAFNSGDPAKMEEFKIQRSDIVDVETAQQMRSSEMEAFRGTEDRKFQAKNARVYSGENVYDELLPQPKTKIPTVGMDKTWSTARVPVEISFPEPTAREQQVVSQIKRDLFHILRYVANKSNFASATMDPKFKALAEVNADMTGIKQIRAFTEGALKFLDSEGLADYEAESVYRKRALPYFRGLGVDENDIKTKLTKLPAQVPLRSSGRDGADMFLPPIGETGIADIDNVEKFAYELYKEVAREDSLVRAGKMAVGAMPETGEVSRQVGVEKKAGGAKKMYDAIKDKRLRVLVKEFIIQNLNQQDVVNAAMPPDFFAAERDENPTISKPDAEVKWRVYAEKNADVAKNKALEIVAENLSGKIRTRPAVSSKSVSLAAKLTPKQRAAAVAKAFDYYSAHIAQDLDGDSVVKLMNTALFGDEIQTMIGKSFAETKSIELNNAFINEETGEVLKPKVRGEGLRVVSTAEILDLARAAGSDIQPYTEFARNNDLKFAFDQKTGDIWIVKAKSIDKTGRIRDIDIEFQPRGIYDNPPTVDQATESLRQYGLDEMFGVRQVDESGAWVLAAKKNGLYKGIVGTMLPDNILDNRRMRNQMIRKLLDAGIQKNFIDRAVNRLNASGLDVEIDPTTVRVETLVKGDKIGPFTYKPHLRPEYSVRITDPMYGIPQKLAEVASMQLEAEREQRLGSSPMLEAALDEGKIPSMQGQASPVTGKIEPVGFRSEGTRRLTLTPSEQVLLKRIKMNGRLGGLLAGAGILAGTGASILSSGAKTEEQVASVALPSAAIETLGAISPTAAAAAGLGWTAVNRGDMLRALVNLVGSVGGGAIGATAGAFGGPVGSFAGGFAGSTLGATVTDSIYSAITGNEGYVPPNVATAPVAQAAGIPTGVTPPTAALRNKIAEDPMSKIREEFA